MSFDGERIEDTLKRYEPLIRFKVFNIYRKLGRHSCTISLEDLYQAGRLGIIEAHNTFDCSKNVPFSAYVSLRIAYSLYSEISSTLQVEKRAVKNVRTLQNDRRILEIIYGRNVTETELADFAGEDEKSFSVRVQKQQEGASGTVSLNDCSEEFVGCILCSQDADTEELAYQSELKNIIERCLKYLTPIERRIINDSFYNNQTLEDIGLRLGVSKQRIFKVREQALKKISSRLGREKFVWQGD
ncbi:MAG: sigma-70 family RNA polymerase sigma factor [Desulfovibrio sp.]|jgi:RNA polymerase sigma factor for flagellar operon FliA|nr:sigma-70 family RNA polymerase sigma factor [Desulfovibrio sp.]